MREPKICSVEGCGAKHRARGFCQKHYAEWLKKRPAVDTSPMRVQGQVSPERLGDFQYQANDADMEYWEKNDIASPLHVPAAITKRYPHLDFHWCSEKKWEKTGKNWQGWQKFQDSEYKDGLKRGNDLFLAAMPKEKAQRYRDHVALQSIERLRATQAKALTAQLGNTMDAKELEAMGAKGATPGVTIGERPRTRTQFGNRMVVGGGFVRGMKKSEIREIARREIEDRRKNRVYSLPSR